jgi:tRNA 2-thiouridine synthesizing protein A
VSGDHAEATGIMAESKAGKAKPKSAAKDKPKAPEPSAVNMRGLKCPLPVLKTRKLLSRMAVGELLVIECTDPLVSIDIPNLLRETGDRLEDTGKKGRVLIFTIRKN